MNGLVVHDLGAVSPSRVIIAGDWHGNALWAMAAVSDAARLLADEEYPCIVVLGDFGLWPGTSGQQYLNALHDSLTAVNGRLYFIDGNHDDHARLASILASSRMTGALPLDEDARVNWLPRNTRWTWHGRTWLALGGAVSLDRAVRKPGKSWWPEEQITPAQSRQAIADGHADVMVTHDCPAGVRHSFGKPPSFWADRDLARSDVHRERLQGVVDAVQPRWLMHGHLHRAYQRECDFGYGPVEVTGLDCDGGKGLGANYLVLDVRTMTWESPAL